MYKRKSQSSNATVALASLASSTVSSDALLEVLSATASVLSHFFLSLFLWFSRARSISRLLWIFLPLLFLPIFNIYLRSNYRLFIFLTWALACSRYINNDN